MKSVFDSVVPLFFCKDILNADFCHYTETTSYYQLAPVVSHQCEFAMCSISSSFMEPIGVQEMRGQVDPNWHGSSCKFRTIAPPSGHHHC